MEKSAHVAVYMGHVNMGSLFIGIWLAGGTSALASVGF